MSIPEVGPRKAQLRPALAPKALVATRPAATPSDAFQRTTPTAKATTCPAGEKTPEENNPRRLFRMLDDGEASITIPLIPERYGECFKAYRVTGKAPTVTLSIKTVAGRLVPSQAKAVFSPPVETFGWTSVPRISLEKDGRIRLEIRGFPDMHISLLALDRLPLELTELYDTVTAKLDQPGSASEPSPLRDQSTWQIHLKGRLSAGALPTGDKETRITLAPGSEVDIQVKPGQVKLTSERFAFAQLGVQKDALTLRGTHVSGRGSLVFTTKADCGKIDVTSFTAALEDVSVQAAALKTRANDGTSVEIDHAALTNAKIAFCVVGDKLVGTPRIDATVQSAALRSAYFPSPSGTLTMAKGEVSGHLHMQEGELDAAFTSANLRLEGKDLRSESGFAQIGFGAAEVKGPGSVIHAGRSTCVLGPLEVHGRISDARIGKPEDAFFADLASGSAFDGAIDALMLGKPSAAFLARLAALAHGNESDRALAKRAQQALDARRPALRGDVRATLDSGALHLASGAVVHLKRGSAAVLTLEGDGKTMRGRAEIDAVVDAELPAQALQAPGVQLRSFDPLSGRARFTLDDVTLTEDGALSIGKMSARARATVTQVRARLAQPQREEPALRILPGTIDLQGLSLPERETIGAQVMTVDASFQTPINAGELDDKPISLPWGKYSFVAARPGTRATFRFSVREGKIPFETVRVSFEPPLDGPAFLDASEVKVDARGHLLLCFDLGFDVDLTKQGFLGGKTFPSTLAGLIALGQETQSGIIPLSAGAGVLEAAQRSKMTLDAWNIGFCDNTIDLGGGSSLRPAADSVFELHVAGDQAQLSGHAHIESGTIETPGLGLGGLSGAFDVNALVRGDGALREAHMTLSNGSLHAANARISRSSGDELHLQDAEVQYLEAGISVGPSRIDASARLSGVSSGIARSRAVLGVGDQRVFAQVGSGAMANGKMDFSPNAIALSADLRNLQVSSPSQLGQLAKPALQWDGHLAYATSSPLRFEGKGAGEVTLLGGSFGQPGALQLKLGRAKVKIGVAHMEAKDGALEASGNVAVALSGGEITFASAAKPAQAVKLAIAPASRATLSLSSVRHAAKDRFAAMEGTLRFTARLRSSLEGLALAEGVQITRMGAHTGLVEVTVKRATLKEDGTLRFGGIGMELSSGD